MATALTAPTAAPAVKRQLRAYGVNLKVRVSAYARELTVITYDGLAGAGEQDRTADVAAVLATMPELTNVVEHGSSHQQYVTADYAELAEEPALELEVAPAPATEAAELELILETASRWYEPTLDVAEAERAAARPTGERVVVIPCSAGKLDQPARAGDLYLGSFHKIARQAADAMVARGEADRVLILSALYGAVELDRWLAPYNVTVGDPGTVTEERVAAQLADAAVVIALVPSRYVLLLRDVAGAVATPLLGSSGIGVMRGRLAAIRDARHAA